MKNAKEVIEQLFNTNQYQTYKQLENKLDQIKKELKSRMDEDEKRKTLHNQGVVCKFTKTNIYSTDNQRLNEYLYNLGILEQTVKMENIPGLEKFKLEDTYHIRINAKMKKEEFDFTDFSETELIQEWLVSNKEFNNLEKIIKKARKRIEKCSELIEEGKVSFEHGSISRIKNQCKYDVQAISKELGAKFVIENSKPIFGEIEKFIENGFLTEKEVSTFKTLINIELKFIVTEVESENKILNILTNKQMNRSLNKQMAI